MEKDISSLEHTRWRCQYHVVFAPKYRRMAIYGEIKKDIGFILRNLKYKYGNRHFWARGYYVDTVGRNKKAIAEYIRNQLKEDELADQISIREYYDPFTGEEYPKRGKNAASPFTGSKKP